MGPFLIRQYTCLSRRIETLPGETTGGLSKGVNAQEEKKDPVGGLRCYVAFLDGELRYKVVSSPYHFYPSIFPSFSNRPEVVSYYHP
jgi:hypothetical protein